MTATFDDLDRRIARLAVPALGALAVEPLYVLVDTAIVGHLGTTPLGGLALASTALNSLVWICNFLAYGTTARVAWLTGRRDDAGAGAVAVQGLWLCGVLAGGLHGVAQQMLRYVSPASHVTGFLRGTLGAADVAYFVSLTVIAVASARWTIRARR